VKTPDALKALNRRTFYVIEKLRRHTLFSGDQQKNEIYLAEFIIKHETNIHNLTIMTSYKNNEQRFDELCKRNNLSLRPLENSQPTSRLIYLVYDGYPFHYVEVLRESTEFVLKLFSKNKLVSTEHFDDLETLFKKIVSLKVSLTDKHFGESHPGSIEAAKKLKDLLATSYPSCKRDAFCILCRLGKGLSASLSCIDGGTKVGVMLLIDGYQYDGERKYSDEMSTLLDKIDGRFIGEMRYETHEPVLKDLEKLRKQL
jgi:hypothetical protein